MEQLLWKTVWQFFKKKKKVLPCDLGIPCLGIHPQLLKAESQGDNCTPMFTETLLSHQRVETTHGSVDG